MLFINNFRYFRNHLKTFKTYSTLFSFFRFLALVQGAINSPKCGKRPLIIGRNADEKIVGGTTSKPGDWGISSYQILKLPKIFAVIFLGWQVRVH